jgi:hypothetical protein
MAAMTVRQEPATRRGFPADPDAGLRQLALRSLKRKSEFRSHLLVYLTVNALLWGIWLVTSLGSGSWFVWPVFPMLGWAVGLVLHANAAYARTASRPAAFSPAQVHAEMNRLRRG